MVSAEMHLRSENVQEFALRSTSRFRRQMRWSKWPVMCEQHVRFRRQRCEPVKVAPRIVAELLARD